MLKLGTPLKFAAPSLPGSHRNDSTLTFLTNLYDTDNFRTSVFKTYLR